MEFEKLQGVRALHEFFFMIEFFAFIGWDLLLQVGIVMKSRLLHSVTSV